MKKIFILEDQAQCLALIKRVIQAVFGERVSIIHQSRIQDVNDEHLTACDIAFIDLSLPDGLSFEVIETCKALHPDAPIIVTTLYAEDDMVFKALRAGADGYLLKSDGEARLTRCLNRILRGEPPISPRIARKLMTHFRAADSPSESSSESPPQQRNASPQLLQLTSRETDVLIMIAQGMVTKEIARSLELSVHTINDNVKSIYKKLNINSRAQAAALAFHAGLA